MGKSLIAMLSVIKGTLAPQPIMVRERRGK
jgi:hypothetical protein